MKQNKPEFHKEPSQVTDKLAPLPFQGHLGKAPELGSLNMPEDPAASGFPQDSTSGTKALS